LFQYIDGAGEARAIESADVNGYLKEISGEDFTSKDFRTWAGTVLAAAALHAAGPSASPTEAKKIVARVVESVAARLGNTRAVCRKCYIHPEVIDSYLGGTLADAWRGRRSAEARIVALLERQRRREAGRRRRHESGESLARVLRRSI